MPWQPASSPIKSNFIRSVRTCLCNGPIVLLERIIQASSNESYVVLDPFCGCGTTIAAARLEWCRSPRVSKGETRTLEVSLLLTRGSAPGTAPPETHDAMPGTQAPSPESVPKNADGLSKHSSSGISSAITPEEPALQAGAPALPA